MRASILAALTVMCFALACGDSSDGGGGGSSGSAGTGGSAGNAGAPGDARAGSDGAVSGPDGSAGAAGSMASGTDGSSGNDGADSSQRESGGTDADSGGTRADREGSDSRVNLDAPDGSNGSCGGAICTATQVCIAYRVVGGAVIRPDDAGSCPSGQHSEGVGAGSYCLSDFAYRCVELVGCNSTPVTCACASSIEAGAGTCPTGYPFCRNPQPVSWLNPAAQLICELLAP